MGKAITTIIILIVIIVAGILLFGGNGSENTDISEGHVVFSITDAAADMENISEVTLGIDSVEVYSETEGWVSTDLANDSFELLALNESGEWQLLADTNLAVDTYSRIRLNIDGVGVKEEGGEESQATLASNSIEVDAIVRVVEEETTSVNLDIIASDSLFTSVEEEYIFAPVVVVESRSNAEVNVSNSGIVTVSGGIIDTTVNVGVDVNGTSKTNFRLDPETVLEVVGGTIQVQEVEESDTAVEGEAGVDVEVDSDTVDMDIEGTLETDLQVN